MLLNGVTIEKIREGYSKVRNRAIANAFSYMRIIEEWGSGIPRMFDEFSRYGLAEPKLVDMDGDFRVNFYRNSDNKNVPINVPIKDEHELRDRLLSRDFTKKKIDRIIQVVSLIVNDKGLSMEDIAGSIGVNSRTIKRDIDVLKEIGVLDRDGSRKTGKWIVNIE